MLELLEKQVYSLLQYFEWDTNWFVFRLPIGRMDEEVGNHSCLKKSDPTILLSRERIPIEGSQWHLLFAYFHCLILVSRLNTNLLNLLRLHSNMAYCIHSMKSYISYFFTISLHLSWACWNISKSSQQCSYFSHQLGVSAVSLSTAPPPPPLRLVRMEAASVSSSNNASVRDLFPDTTDSPPYVSLPDCGMSEHLTSCCTNLSCNLSRTQNLDASNIPSTIRMV